MCEVCVCNWYKKNVDAGSLLCGVSALHCTSCRGDWCSVLRIAHFCFKQNDQDTTKTITSRSTRAPPPPPSPSRPNLPNYYVPPPLHLLQFLCLTFSIPRPPLSTSLSFSLSCPPRTAHFPAIADKKPASIAM